MGEFSNLYRCERCGLEQDPEAAPHTADDCITNLRAKLAEAQAEVEAERTAREQANSRAIGWHRQSERNAKGWSDEIIKREQAERETRNWCKACVDAEVNETEQRKRTEAAEAHAADLQRQLGEANAEIVEFSESTRKAGEDADEANSESDRVHRLHNVSSCPACGGPREDRPCDLCDSVGYVRVDDSAVVDQLAIANQRITDQQAEIVRLRKRAAEIADDYHPGHDSECKQALTEMRDAVDALADDPITPTPDPRDEQIRVLQDVIKYKVYGWRESDWPEGFCRTTAELIADSVRDSFAAMTSQPEQPASEQKQDAEQEKTFRVGHGNVQTQQRAAEMQAWADLSMQSKKRFSEQESANG